jgi:CRISPR-associated protein Csd1
MAPEGWIAGGLDFLIVLDRDGNYKGLECLQEQEGKKTQSKSMLLPCIGNQALKHSNSGKDANLLWDNSSFVLGLGDKGALRLSSMLNAIDDWFAPGENAEVDAVRAFLARGLADRNFFNLILNDAQYGEFLHSGQPKMSFRIENSTAPIVFKSDFVRKKISENSVKTGGENDEIKGTCLITGEQNAPISLTHSVIKGLRGAQSSGACMVGFNKDSFLSYGKKQSANAPVSKNATIAYVKGLNFLLNSAQRFQIGDTSIICWSEKKTNFEIDFPFFFKEPEKDNPDAKTEHILSLFNSVNIGEYLDDSECKKFYVLGLAAPSKARVTVRFWKVGTVAEFSGRIRQYFEDLRIVKAEREYYSVWQLLKYIAIRDEEKNVPPNLAGDFMCSILSGTSYPVALLQAAIRRIKSDTEDRVKPVRAALIKAYLNRYYREHSNTQEKEIAMSLDTEQPSIGYQLGRLFATLEKVQEEANGSATIQTSYYGAACTSPVSVFGTLMRLDKYHLGKLEKEKPGLAIKRKKLIEEITSHFSDFPPYLNLREQGKFAIGYYHQQQDFFKGKEQ